MKKLPYIVISLLSIGALVAAMPLLRHKEVDYNSAVKPILNKRCIACHGGVRRKGGFSLLTREDALAPTESGKPAIVPGKPEASAFIARLHADDPEERMPYREAPLPKDEIEILTRWVAEGANWDRHWAYQPVQAPSIPSLKGGFLDFFRKENVDWVKENIDKYILHDLASTTLKPSPEADPLVLLQRVSFDLTGLPPDQTLAGQYLKAADQDKDGAYAMLVDSLLASPHYGERWTALWLDLARYADSKGYERDDERQIWRYRDWLIRAFNEDMPYDQFLTEQLAGDLLPHPSDAQYVATAFHRNTMTNDEGGTENEEFRTAAVIDRVNTTWETLMGTTFACVQCHSHPYDPFQHEEYYKFMAFFNNTRDEDTYEEYPLLRHFGGADSLKFLTLQGWLAQTQPSEKTQEIVRFLRTWQPAFYSIAADSLQNSALYDTKWLMMRQNGVARFKNVALDGKSRLIYRYWASLPGGRWSVRLDRPDGPLLFQVSPKVTQGRQIEAVDFPPVEGRHDLWFHYENPRLRNNEDTGIGYDWFWFTTPFPGQGMAGQREQEQVFWELLRASTPTTPIMVEAPAALARTTHVFERGNWLVPGNAVAPMPPAHLNPFPQGAPHNRLGLAQWMCDPQHPLTSRTIANRIWEQLFGTGLVETLEDLGTQGSQPAHQTLLDYLAWQLMHTHHWSLKSLLREIVLSATYRQSSQTSPAALALDPTNRYCARGPRVRLSAEQIRDRCLSVSGLLSPKLYGPSVMPYQPDGIWKAPWNGAVWKKSNGDDQYRRSLYTYWKRGSPYPTALTFDGATREVCTARRVRTNTPLQALAMLNDSSLNAAARQMAKRITADLPGDVPGQIAVAFHQAVGWHITPAKLHTLEQLYQQALDKFLGDIPMAGAFLDENLQYESAQPKLVGRGTAASNTAKTVNKETAQPYAHLAALSVVTNAILNLDEFVTKN